MVIAVRLRQIRDRALSSGFDEYLRKPVEPHALIRAIRARVRPH